MNLRYLAVTALFALAGTAYGQIGYTISGGISNFDVTNRCDVPCDEFEVEIEGIRPEDVVHTYHNGNYGAPTVTLSSTGSSTIIDYRNPQHLTPVNVIEHFGISLRVLSTSNATRVRWMRSGQTATVNGQVPVPGGSSAPATQPIMPSITTEKAAGSTGGDGISMTVTNNDASQSIWIKRRAQITTGQVLLESLMRADPVVVTSIQLDAAPIRLEPGASFTIVSDLIEVEDNQSAVFTAEYYQDLFVNGGPFGGQSHILGPSIGNVMTATIASPDGTCQASAPIIQEQPQNVTLADGMTANVRVRADGNDVTLTYQWMKEGVPLAESAMYHAVNTDELSIEEVTAASEGFYQVRISNACGWVISNSALVFVTGHNLPPVRITACGPSDIAGPGQAAGPDASLTADDIIVFLNAFFAGTSIADVAGPGQDPTPDAQFTADDIIVFLNRFFAGC